MNMKQRHSLFFATALMATAITLVARAQAAATAATATEGQWNTLWDYWSAVSACTRSASVPSAPWRSSSTAGSSTVPCA